MFSNQFIERTATYDVFEKKSENFRKHVFFVTRDARVTYIVSFCFKPFEPLSLLLLVFFVSFWRQNENLTKLTETRYSKKVKRY